VTGRPGFQGRQGVQGRPGRPGFQGVQGPQGPQGAQGRQGRQGFQGTQGRPGTFPLGATGRPGRPGRPGRTGRPGPTGPQGAQGRQGFQGRQGSAGPTGTLGTSTPALGVGTAAGPTGTLRATGDITAGVSDRRLKTNIEKIKNAGEKLYSINGVFYIQSKEAEQFGYNNYRKQVGVIAQEVEKVLPEVVKPAPFDSDENNISKSGNKYLTVQYEKIVPLIVETIKEQQEEIEELTRILYNVE
jgi:hypothetical protein